MKLELLENECNDLLSQANVKIQKFSKEVKSKYEDYEKTIKDVQMWYSSQQCILKILDNIAELKYILYMGNVTRSNCNDILIQATEQSENANNNLLNWHNNNSDKFKISLVENKRKRQGINGLIYSVPGKFNDEKNYKNIEEETTKAIEMQTSSSINKYKEEKKDFYNEKVELIRVNDKIYLLKK